MQEQTQTKILLLSSCSVFWLLPTPGRQFASPLRRNASNLLIRTNAVTIGAVSRISEAFVSRLPSEFQFQAIICKRLWQLHERVSLIRWCLIMALASPMQVPPSEPGRHNKASNMGSDSMSPSPGPSSSLTHSPQTSPRHELTQAPPVEQALLSVGFNQDYGCFACGTQTGFRIYNCDPFKETFRREFDGAGIALVEMLFRCNILALVGGGKSPKYSPNKVMIWDDHQSRCIGELSFRSEVRAVRLRRDRIVVVLEFKIYVYNFADLKLLHQIETLSNTKGICALSPGPTSCVLACPGQRRGEIRIELYSAKKTRFVQAHDSSLACLALSQDGQLLATASNKGTLIRIFSTVDGSKLQELRRGAERAEIYSIAFSANLHWLAVSSDKGTVHVFGLKRNTEETRSEAMPTAASPNGTALASGGSSGYLLGGPSSLLSFAASNAGSSLAFMKGVLPKYFSSEWSFAQFHVPEETKTIVAFGPQKNTVIIVGANGSYYRCSFDGTNGGGMVQAEYERFMKHDETEEETVTV
ncbi:hypothetical protein M758_10G044400 [Ceratodon purpureus]|nr:hypothetical protein M758_10G044400 [Ceratodon purpureus]